jgi:hypothetical protein
MNGGDGVPVVRRADHDSVDVLVGEEVVVVGVCGHSVVGLAGLLAVLLLDEPLAIGETR